MTALLVSPDYVSHYLPLAAVGAALRDGTRWYSRPGTASAIGCSPTGSSTWNRLRLGAGSNATPETYGDDPSLTGLLAATREGMVATLELQARRRLHDLLWEPERVTQRLAEIVDDLRPALVLSDQLALGRPCLPCARHPLHVVPSGTSVPAATAWRTVRLPGPPTGGIRAGGRARGAARALHARAERAFTRRFNETLLDLDRTRGPSRTPSPKAPRGGRSSTTPAASPAPGSRPEPHWSARSSERSRRPGARRPRAGRRAAEGVRRARQLPVRALGCPP